MRATCCDSRATNYLCSSGVIDRYRLVGAVSRPIVAELSVSIDGSGDGWTLWLVSGFGVAFGDSVSAPLRGGLLFRTAIVGLLLFLFREAVPMMIAAHNSRIH
jgi:hypothetical protein